MNRHADAEIRRHLESGERLIWSGSPKQGLLLRPSDTFLIPFSLLWGGFAFFWEWSVLNSESPGFFALWGIPFVLVGVYFIVGRFFVDARMRSNTYYGLTDRRVLILSGLTSRSVQSTPLRTLHEIGLSEKSDRSGTIVFGSPHPMAAWYQGFAWPGMRQYQTPSFEGIADARAVHSEILNAQRAAV